MDEEDIPLSDGLNVNRCLIEAFLSSLLMAKMHQSTSQIGARRTNSGQLKTAKVPGRICQFVRTSLWSRLAFLALTAIVLPLSSCVCVQKARFKESEFAWFGHAGTGAIRGHAYVEMDDKTTFDGKYATVTVLPDNAYTREMITRERQPGEKLRQADSRLKNHMMELRADDHGNFSVNTIGSGHYLVVSRVHWIDRSKFPKMDNIQPDDSCPAQIIFATIEVRNGYITEVTDWAQGRGADWDLDAVLH